MHHIYNIYIVYSVIHTQQNIVMENCVLLFGLDDKITKNTNKIGLKYFSQKI